MANVERSYEEFQPAMDWIRQPGSDTLAIELQGFQREQVRLQLDNSGNLKINVERPLDNKKWSRFRKEFPIPENANIDEMRARFENGTLYVVIPKKVNWVDDTHKQPTLIKESQTTTQKRAKPDSVKDRSSTDKKTTSTAYATGDKQMNSVQDRSGTDTKTTSTAVVAGDKQMNSVKDSSVGTDKRTTSTAEAADDKRNTKSLDVANATKEMTMKKKEEYVDKGKLVDGLMETATVDGGLGGGLVSEFVKSKQLMVRVVVAFLVGVALGIYVTYHY